MGSDDNAGNYIVGVDPGTHTGYAIADAQKLLIVESGTFIQVVCDILAYEEEYGSPACIYVEDARKTGYHPNNSNASKWQGVGSIKRDCKLWEETCQHFGWESHFQAPMNSYTKWDAERFEDVTGWESRTNEHKRDAGCIAWVRKDTL